MVAQRVQQHQFSQQSMPLVPLSDRKSNNEAMVLAFVAENNLPFTMTPKLIALAQNLAKDSKALSELSMDQTSASYKTRFGVAKTFSESMIYDLQTAFFSLNIDEATSQNLHKVLAVLVSYYSKEHKKVVVQHLDSISVIKVNSESLFSELTKLFEKHQHSWSQLISILIDSANVMHGSKSGLEVHIRNELANHLLDIDGDSCHHAHNA